jgi:hypothetical protein
MNKYYCVATTIYDDGLVLSNVVSTKIAEERPQSKTKTSPNADYYWDWFDSLSEAQEFVILTKKK